MYVAPGTGRVNIVQGRNFCLMSDFGLTDFARRPGLGPSAGATGAGLHAGTHAEITMPPPWPRYLASASPRARGQIVEAATPAAVVAPRLGSGHGARVGESRDETPSPLRRAVRCRVAATLAAIRTPESPLP